MPVGFEKEALLALAYYRELQSEQIEFTVEPELFPLASRPALLPLLFPWLERKYHIIISNKSKIELEPILLKNMPAKARLGVLGHELAHTSFYYR